jgi:hypothetical protein
MGMVLLEPNKFVFVTHRIMQCQSQDLALAIAVTQTPTQILGRRNTSKRKSRDVADLISTVTVGKNLVLNKQTPAIMEHPSRVAGKKRYRHVG